ncbi:MAG: hypothetical protein VYB39_01395 [Pseudomonadota bacterium]|nr:hypothetical protein [Pseudomonadota bacterium]
MKLHGFVSLIVVTVFLGSLLGCGKKPGEVAPPEGAPQFPTQYPKPK